MRLCTRAPVHPCTLCTRRRLSRRVILPAECVDTYETPLEVARELGIYAHPGDFHHVVFLHHMAANGVEVVKALC